MAHAMGVDYIEQDAVLTRDNALIVLHDLFLDAVTDVAERFAGRERQDGHFYAIDFDLDEIRSLCVHERQTADGTAAFAGRFPPEEKIFRVPTLEEELRLIRGLNQSRGKDVGVYIEPKAPSWHQQQGRDIMRDVLSCLETSGYRLRTDKAILQSFDFEHLLRCRTELDSDLKLVQLIGDNSWRESASDFDFLQTAEGLREIATFADGIGPWLMQLLEIRGNGDIEPTSLVSLAHGSGLFVHGYTLRADQLPVEAGTLEDAVDLLAHRVGLDGVFTDHPDRVVRWRNG